VDCPNCGSANTEGSRFCSTCATPLATSGQTAPRQTRKTVTVLFVDAVSSTELGERIDIEAVRAVMTRYFEAMREVIEFHGGSVEKFIGDAVMAVFGVPTLHEDDALRACRAAIEIRDRLAELEPQIRADRGVSIEWRIGINTGSVVVGDVTAGQRMVTGDSVNVAARLETAAAPGEILIGEETHALVRGDVTAQPVAPLELKGKREPVPAWRLVGVDVRPGRQARRQDAPMVGRRRPLRLLDDAYREASEERVCHLFTVLGVAGVGKSRLVEEFIANLGDEPLVATGRCLAYGSGITYWPVAEAVRGGIGIAEAASADDARSALTAALADEAEGARAVAAVSNLIGLTDTAVDQAEVFWAVRKTFEALARQQPLILVFDDVHWGEPTFLDLVEHIADWAREAPILLIVMARPDLLEKRPAWGGGKRSATTLQLEALSEPESDELVLNLLGKTDVPAEFRARVAHAAEGNPLFVEELVAKLIHDGFLQRADDGWSAVGDLRELAIPSTIQALLAARLDSLGAEERTVIESAAVEGKTFHGGAVSALAAEPLRDHVRERLAGLVRMELVRPDQAAFVGEEAYRFRHLLIRDAAYQAIAKQTRSELHARFAAWLERKAADRAVEFEEIVAYHLEQAYRYRVELGPPDEEARELALRAGNLLADAGKRASRRDDVAATSDLLGRALKLLPKDVTRARRLELLLGPALYRAGNGPGAERMLTRAIADADEAGDEGASARAAVILTAVQASTRSTETSLQLREFDRLAGVLERAGDRDAARLAQALAAFSLFGAGKAGEAAARAADLLDQGPSDEPWYSEARNCRGVALAYGPTPIDEAIAFAQQQLDSDPGSANALGARRGIAMLRTLQGRFAEARELLATARAAWEELGNRHQLAGLSQQEAALHYYSGDIDAAALSGIKAFEGMRATGDRAYASTVAVDVAHVQLDLGNLEESWRYATIARETSSSDDVISQAGGRAIQARIHARRGEHEAAESLAREADAIMAATDYLVQHGEVVEHLAHVLHDAARIDEAVEAARRAKDLYDRKGATLLVDRVARLIAAWESARAEG
jgi:class 3 adenylate cyclase/tetratricopeptide (TPR) repeat protein